MRRAHFLDLLGMTNLISGPVSIAVTLIGQQVNGGLVILGGTGPVLSSG